MLKISICNFVASPYSQSLLIIVFGLLIIQEKMSS